MRRAARTTLARSSDPAWIWDPDLERIVWANAAGLAFWGEPGLADLFERRFSPEDALSRAMRQVRARLAEDRRDDAPMEIDLLLHPAGDPVALACRIQETDLPDRRIGLAVVGALEPRGEAAVPERLSRIVAQAPVALALFDENGALLMQNRLAERLFGAGDPASLAQPTLSRRYADPETGRKAIRTALMEGFFSHTDELATATEKRRLRVALARFDDPVSGAPTVLGAFWEAPSAPDALPARQQALALMPRDRLARALDHVAHGLALFDSDSLELLYANAEGARLMGAEPDAPEADALLSASLGALFPAEHDRIEAAFEALRSGAQQSAEVDLASTAAREPGAPRGPWLSARLSLLREQDPALLVMSLFDLGRERRTLLRLKLAEDERAAALEALELGVVFIDDAGLIQNTSAAAKRLMGVDEDEEDDALEQASLPELLAAPDAQRFAEYLRSGPLAAGRRFEGGAEVTLKGLDGVERAVRLAITPPSRRNRGRRCVALSPVETALPAAPAPLTPSPGGDELLRAALLARAGHDLREPLTSVKGFAELMRDDEGLPQRYRGYLGDIVEAADQIAGEIDTVLASAAALEPQLATATPSAPARPRIALGALAQSQRDRLIAERGETAERIRLEIESELQAPVDQAALGEALDVLFRRSLAASGYGPLGRRPSLRLYRGGDGAPRFELIEGALDLPDAEIAAARGGQDSARLTELRLASLLVEKAGGALRRSAEVAGVERLEIRLPG